MSLREIYNLRKPTIRDKGWEFPFGKYKGWKLADVMEHDPGYLSFLQSKEICDFHSEIFDEIDEFFEPKLNSATGQTFLWNGEDGFEPKA